MTRRPELRPDPFQHHEEADFTEREEKLSIVAVILLAFKRAGFHRD